MMKIEIIDRFCDITSQKPDIIRKLVNIIAQANIIDDDITLDILDGKSEIDDELDFVEHGNRDNIS